MNHLVVKNIGGDPDNLGWPAGQSRYFLYSLAMTCAAGLALWNSLTVAQKIAQAQPMPRPGNFQLRSCDGGTGPVDPGEPTDDLEEDITFTGQNVSDAPSSNPAVMDVVFTFLGTDECSAKVNWTSQPEAGKTLRICYNTMGYLSVADIEARTYACGEEHLFQGYHMTGMGDDGQRSDTIPNAHQLICYF
jgi:hypothetical protein